MAYQRPHTIILRGPGELSDWALRVVREYGPQIAGCDVGTGWGVHNRTLGVSGFIRRTKGGISINFYRDEP